MSLIEAIQQTPVFDKLLKTYQTESCTHLIELKNPALALHIGAIQAVEPSKHLVVLSDEEAASYFYNDLQNLYPKSLIYLFPHSAMGFYTERATTENANVIQRTEVLTQLEKDKNCIVVSYPDALFEKVVSKDVLSKNSFSVSLNERCSMDFLIDLLFEYAFERTQFVTEPGQFAVRGGLIDVWSYSLDFPCRLEFFGDEIDNIRLFDPSDQISIKKMHHITLTPDVSEKLAKEERVSLIQFWNQLSCIWIKNTPQVIDKISHLHDKADEKWSKIKQNTLLSAPEKLFISSETFLKELGGHKVIEIGKHFQFKSTQTIVFKQKAQLSFNKNFNLLIAHLTKAQNLGYQLFIASDKQKQIQRIEEIFEDFTENEIRIGKDIKFTPQYYGLSEGFEDENAKILVFTDHQIFDRYHRYKVKDSFKKSKQALTIQEITGLQKGDFVTHIDYGIGVFDGLEMMEVNGKLQEAVRLLYKGSDLLYVSIQSIHKIAKYTGKDGKAPSLNKLGTNTWKNKKAAAKNKVKSLAFDLIKLYANRKVNEGFAFSLDHPYQNELEASFVYEDTPDQEKCTTDVKRDMEKAFPMDRLICGDVGFGKTEIAIRAAFKAAIDGKQTAILVPTTILSFQHFKTFSERLKNFPVRVDYINRFRTTKEIKGVLQDLAAGKIDIIIGTHRLVGKDIVYHDLGLLIVDEEQKFGVSVKDKLKTIKANLDTLTLTATPIPRTLQFSLLGARDLSVINTPPPNRYPVETIVTGFNEEVIRDALIYELARGGQVYFIHNRVENIKDVAGVLQRLVPNAKISIGHGQMDGKKLEQVMLDFMEGDFDVLVATTIIESGLDIPNANTIIINAAQNFGLSDLHQMRGRVGRSNKKAYCYLLAPPISTLTPEARKRLQAVEDFSDLGSGFNIAMRDLDIRGAGDLLGAEQSGFISDLGYETYQKILNEAITELKEEEFKDLYTEELNDENRLFVQDCTIDTDLEILIPSNYVNSVDERLKLYNRLNTLQKEEELTQFKHELVDRFGALPNQVEELMDAMRLKWLAIKIGIEKIILKNNQLKAYFITNPQSAYYNSAIFGKVLLYVQSNAQLCKMKEDKGKLTTTFFKINNINTAQKLFSSILEPVMVNG